MKCREKEKEKENRKIQKDKTNKSELSFCHTTNILLKMLQKRNFTTLFQYFCVLKKYFENTVNQKYNFIAQYHIIACIIFRQYDEGLKVTKTKKRD